VADYRVLVTGSRSFTAAAVVDEALSGALARAINAGAEQMVIVHGDCRTGADAFAASWVRWHESWPTPLIRITQEPHPARWQLLGRRAGPARNQEMVSSGIDEALSFFLPGVVSKGTADCVQRAEAAGITTRRLTGG